MLSVSSISVCLSLLVEGQTPPAVRRLTAEGKTSRVNSMSILSLSLLLFVCAFGVATVYVNIGRLHSLSVYSELFVLSFWPIVSVFFFCLYIRSSDSVFWKGRLHCDSVCHTLPVYSELTVLCRTLFKLVSLHCLLSLA